MTSIAALLLLQVAFSSAPQAGGAALSQKQLDAMTDVCRAPRGWLRHKGGNEVRFLPDPDAEYDKVDCVLKQLRESRIPMNLGFVGNEALPETEKK
ncbi:hypothetical protein [Sphingomonas desiccabilis]|uniref:Uncharacterized protein n=1 Tax=Sphingomonas desiccabilis TaxID=429134 RepID=A0A4Q2IZY7_9SPHN|nr:hypothetical protein [Sphingomonas desiccabilis]MBB3910448.1 hypothetical protein [Sphingomonas desiccabilis]RXZ35098.1 hypothetical protein EO081_05500 [Sphingomonas desiccabilis]